MQMTTGLIDPSTGVSISKLVLIPAAAVVGIASLSCFQPTGERDYARSELCQPLMKRLRDLPECNPSTDLRHVTTSLASSTTANMTAK
jgi:hypothetical protein